MSIFKIVVFIFLLQGLSGVGQANTKNCELALQNPLSWEAGPSMLSNEAHYSDRGDKLIPVYFVVNELPIVVLALENNSEVSGEWDPLLIDKMVQNGSQILSWEDCNPSKSLQNVNCHGFTMMNSYLHFLRSGFWIHSFVDNKFSFGFNPLSLLLNNYFIPAGKIEDIDSERLSEFTFPENSVDEGDILVFINAFNKIIHSGTLTFDRESKTYKILHKLGSGPIMLSPLEHSFMAYPPKYLEIWRKGS